MQCLDTANNRHFLYEVCTNKDQTFLYTPFPYPSYCMWMLHVESCITFVLLVLCSLCTCKLFAFLINYHHFSIALQWKFKLCGCTVSCFVCLCAAQELVLCKGILEQHPSLLSDLGSLASSAPSSYLHSLLSVAVITAKTIIVLFLKLLFSPHHDCFIFQFILHCFCTNIIPLLSHIYPHVSHIISFFVEKETSSFNVTVPVPQLVFISICTLFVCADS